MKTIIRTREQGGAVSLAGILMVVFILCIALFIDLGHLLNVKVQLQRAVDAAALAGVQQLDGSGQPVHPEAVARATAAINRVDGRTGLVTDGGWVDGTSVEIALGRWKTDLNGDPRFKEVAAGAADTANAIKVTAMVDIDYSFFLFALGTTATADAIAVSKYEVAARPIALLSCVPINEGAGSSVCDIKLSKLNNDTDDSGGWTALTYDINAAQLKYFFAQEGDAVLNQIISETGDDFAESGRQAVVEDDNNYDDSIPNQSEIVELDSRYGLGPEFGNDSAPADPFNYVLNSTDSLPSWDNDAFARIWSMDGILLQGYVAEEDQAAYEERLEALRTASRDDAWDTWEDDKYPLPSWAKDGRFAILIEKDGAKTIARFDNALRYIGYPVIAAKNGEDNPVNQKSSDLAMEAAVTVPVIFAGINAEWKTLGDKYYIGTASL